MLNITKTHWLAGFSDAYGNFSIFITKSKTHNNSNNISTPFRITQKNKELLIKIQEVIKGGIIILDKKGAHRYSTVSFKIALLTANYFDSFHLQNQNQILRYFYWRKTLLLIQNKKHLSDEDLHKIMSIKKKLNEGNIGILRD